MTGDELRAKLLLYAVTDSSPRGKRRKKGSLVEAVAQAIAGGATFVQLREKEAAPEEVFFEAGEIKALCQAHGVPFVIDDDVALAARVDADGAHVGQEDTSLHEARLTLAEGKIVGVSCQTVAQAVTAEAGGASYLGVGAVFPTNSKKDADLVSLDTLAAICAAVDIPVVAIGGISVDNMSLLKGTGVAGVALISAIFGAPNIKDATRQLRLMAEHLFG